MKGEGAPLPKAVGYLVGTTASYLPPPYGRRQEQRLMRVETMGFGTPRLPACNAVLLQPRSTNLNLGLSALLQVGTDMSVTNM